MPDSPSNVQYGGQPAKLSKQGVSPDLSITELGLRPRARNALLRAGISTVRDVLAVFGQGDEALLALEGFGPRSLSDLKERLQEQGFLLPGEVAPVPETPETVPTEAEALGVAGARAAETVLEEKAPAEPVVVAAVRAERVPEHTAAVGMETAPETSASLSFGQRLRATFARPREQFSLGAWVYLVIGILVVVVLLLPPISLLERLGIMGYTALNAAKGSISHPDGLALSVDPATFTGRLRVRMESVPRLEFLEGSAGAALRRAVEALPNYLVVKSPLYQIRTRGKASQPVMIDVVIPNDAEPWETLDLYTWTGEAWEWVGAELHTEVAEHEFLRARVTEIPDSVVVVQAGAITPTVSASVEADDNPVTAAAGVVNELNPTGLLLGTDGGFVGDASSLPQPEAGATYIVLPSLRNWAPGATVNRGLLSDVLTIPEIQEAHVANVVQLCTGRGFAGVDVDYRGVAPEEREAYSGFIRALADALHAQGLRLTVVVEPPTPTDGGWDTGGYDWAGLGAAADAVKVPLPDDPATYVEGGKAQRMLEWAISQVPRYRLRMLVSSLSADWNKDQVNYVSLEQALAPFGEAMAFSDVMQVAPGSQVEFGLAGQLLSIAPQEAAGTYRLEYEGDDGASHTVWLGTAANLATKLQWAERYHLGGVMVADMLDPGNAPGIVEAVAGYRAVAAPPAGQELQVVWAAASAAAVVDQQISPLTAPGYTWVVLATTGTYTVNATIAGFDHGSVAVTVGTLVSVSTPEVTSTTTMTPTAVVAEPTEEVTSTCLNAAYVADVTVPDNTQFDNGKEFEKTWRVSNSGTCAWPEDTVLAFSSGTQMDAPASVPVGAVAPGEQKDVTVKMKAPAQAGQYTGVWQMKTAEGAFGTNLTVVILAGQAVPPPSSAPPPVSGGSFELGGQTHTLAHPNEMHYAGMNWVKFQMKWSPGMTGNDVVGRIQQAHASGLKVLLSIPGGSEYPSSIDFAAYVEFLRQVAAQGPDGIEVWNEQNIDREWPTGQINPTAYVQQMLAPAYNAIKSVNPNILVISGAPSPTGFFGGACAPAGCDDAPYVAGMLAAGAASYADCVGIHYNEGILPPSQTSGDPRGSSSHYTRYFWGMVNAYYNAFGGQRKLCFTELGYVSPEGYGTLPANFAWAADTSVAEQAAWLAEATSLSASSGKVRLMIVYNVDFTLWSDQDPQAGYAIIRAGGGCPACDALHNVMGTR